MAGIASGLLQNLLEKLSAKAFEEISLAWHAKGDIQKLMRRMQSIEKVLLDAEEKQNHNKQVSQWLEDLETVLDDAEDVLDEFECEAVRRRMIKKQRSTRKYLRYLFSIFCHPVIFSFKMAHRIKGVNEALDDIKNGINEFQLVEKKVEYGFTNISRETHSYVASSYVFGRDSDKEWIIQKLLHFGVDKELSVISLVGIGGLGKTTLAQLVYTDNRVNEYFTQKMWICVSVDFDVRRLIREILSSATHSDVRKEATLDELQISLRQVLSDKRFLLVLDDVWNEEGNKWEDLKPLLEVGAKGSKILLTTRMDLVAKIMSRDDELKHQLEGLNEEDSWRLFVKHASGDKKEVELPVHLKRIGEEIVKKCKGVPLAIKSLGSLLYSKTNIGEWDYIKNSELWKVKENDDGILPALKLSYQLMPSYLKPCLVYCGLIPKDYQYNAEHVIQLWMANGLLHPRNASEELEDTGLRYIEELFSRSLIEPVEFPIEKWNCPGTYSSNFKIHDLVHDVARSIGRDKYFNEESNTEMISKNVQHVYKFDQWVDNKVFSDLLSLKKARSLIVRMSRESHMWCVTFSKLLFLRVLELSDLRCESLPHELGRLKHLRYLALLDCYMESLPNSICELSSLQTLILQGCRSLSRLPKDIGNLISLRYLSLVCMSAMDVHKTLARIKCLSMLQSLSFDISNRERSDREYDDDDNDETVGNQSVIQSSTLRRLCIHGVYLYGVTRTIPVQFRQYARNLKHLTITRCDIQVLPKWFSELSSLETLEFSYCFDLSILLDDIKSLSTLQVLIICGWSSRFKNMRGIGISDEWDKITHVPTIVVDGRVIKGHPKFLHIRIEPRNIGFKNNSII